MVRKIIATIFILLLITISWFILKDLYALYFDPGREPGKMAESMSYLIGLLIFIGSWLSYFSSKSIPMISIVPPETRSRKDQFSPNEESEAIISLTNKGSVVCESLQITFFKDASMKDGIAEDFIPYLHCDTQVNTITTDDLHSKDGTVSTVNILAFLSKSCKDPKSSELYIKIEYLNPRTMNLFKTVKKYRLFFRKTPQNKFSYYNLQEI